MKQRRPKRRKSFRQPRKRLPPIPPPPEQAPEEIEDDEGTVEPLPIAAIPDTRTEPLRAQAPVELRAADLIAPAPRLVSVPHFSVTDARGGSTKSEIERRLSEQPAAVRDIARALSREFNSQANELKQQRPNDPDRIAQRDKLLVLSNDWLPVLPT
jgi:hypothetical protein